MNIQNHITVTTFQKSLIVSIFSIGLVSDFFSQQARFEVNSPHQFSFEISSGTNQVKVSNATGPEKMRNAVAFHHGLNVRYRYNFSDKFSSRFRIGLHVQNTPIKLEPSKNLILSSYTISGRHNSIYNFFRRLDFSFAYTLKQQKHSSINILGGAGLNAFGSYIFQSGLKFPESPSYFYFEISKRAKPFLQVGIENEFTLKNRDFLTLKLNYQHGFTSFLDGEFEFVNSDFQLSQGKFHNYLRGFNLGVEYTFSQQKKQQKIYELEEGNQISRSEAKKINRKERRYIDPKSMFLKVEFGVGSGINRSMNKNSPYMSTGFNFPAVFPSISFEKGIKNGLFHEYNYFFMKQRSISKIENKLGAWGYSPFYAHYLSAGLGYRVKLPSNFKLFNIHAGLGIGTQFSKKDTLGTSYFEQILYEGSTETITFSSTEEIKRIGHFMPILYLGISKDFRLSNQVAISMSFKRQFGFNPVQVIDVTYTSIENPQAQKARIQVDGSAILFSAGIKIKLDAF